ncbi:MAG: hypothetical protein A2848_02955 [Candidatus Magasanikbacteria bacterium RIFCSPHIGHO2_01_FULL_50_8]|uniref:Uncharacterized protein n=1 Tax=Candidatus Magasanikbacteria bacterium RIFCSPHIGHO2_01_FULL_50_8 TaxID=1798674 RepID=A0A1F6LVR5_9BACT|nr:MAG: hypothetical protein A2848_02955 [Candidatus Magasanikbacteria bacterium RIFCSPHIGHO2_01_FULL_50_8]
MHEIGDPQAVERTQKISELLRVAQSPQLEQLLQGKQISAISYERFTDRPTNQKTPSSVANYHFAVIDLVGGAKIFAMVKPTQSASETWFAHFDGAETIQVTNPSGTKPSRIDSPETLVAFEQQWRRAMPPYRVD